MECGDELPEHLGAARAREVLHGHDLRSAAEERLTHPPGCVRSAAPTLRAPLASSTTVACTVPTARPSPSRRTTQLSHRWDSSGSGPRLGDGTAAAAPPDVPVPRR